MIDVYADLYSEKQQIEKRLETEHDNGLLSRLAEINATLGEGDGPDEDDLIDKWERELEAGVMPDFNEGL